MTYSRQSRNAEIKKKLSQGEVERRLNPETGDVFKRGSRDKQGRYFLRYRYDSLLNGKYLAEEWVSEKRWLEMKEHAAKYRKRTSQFNREQYQSGILEKRINPSTAMTFKFGEQNKEGKYFLKYNSFLKLDDQFIGEEWVDLAGLHRACIKRANEKARRRAKERKLEHKVTWDYLFSIFPSDFRCPVLGIEMTWRGERFNSPSLDRINNFIGYVEGNVAWISFRANEIKSDASYKELKLVTDYLGKIQNEK